MAIPTDEQKIEKRILSRLNKALSKYGLIEDNDRILVGISGGKADTPAVCVTLELSEERVIVSSALMSFFSTTFGLLSVSTTDLICPYFSL